MAFSDGLAVVKTWWKTEQKNGGGQELERGNNFDSGVTAKADTTNSPMKNVNQRVMQNYVA